MTVVGTIVVVFGLACFFLLRREAMATGAIYLVFFVSLGTLIIYLPRRDFRFIAGQVVLGEGSARPERPASERIEAHLRRIRLRPRWAVFLLLALAYAVISGTSVATIIEAHDWKSLLSLGFLAFPLIFTLFWKDESQFLYNSAATLARITAVVKRGRHSRMSYQFTGPLGDDYEGVMSFDGYYKLGMTVTVMFKVSDPSINKAAPNFLFYKVVLEG